MVQFDEIYLALTRKARYNGAPKSLFAELIFYLLHLNTRFNKVLNCAKHKHVLITIQMILLYLALFYQRYLKVRSTLLIGELTARRLFPCLTYMYEACSALYHRVSCFIKSHRRFDILPAYYKNSCFSSSTRTKRKSKAE